MLLTNAHNQLHTRQSPEMNNIIGVGMSRKLVATIYRLVNNLRLNKKYKLELKFNQLSSNVTTQETNGRWKKIISSRYLKSVKESVSIKEMIDSTKGINIFDYMVSLKNVLKNHSTSDETQQEIR